MLWGSNLIIALVTNWMFENMKNAGTFGFYALGSLLSALFFFCTMREIKGMSREEAQKVYSAE